MNENIKVYKMDDYNWIATNLNLDDTILWYANNELIDEDDIYPDLCNMDVEGMWVETDESYNAFTEEGVMKQAYPNINTVGDTWNTNGYVHRYHSFRELIDSHKDEIIEPFYIMCNGEY